jgi:hypothetical protein
MQGYRIVGYYFPLAYKDYALRVIAEDNYIGDESADELNTFFGLNVKKKKGSNVI